MAFAPRSGVGLLGVQDGDHGPSARPVEKAGLQGKSSGVRDPRPLGAGMGSSAFFSQTHEVLPRRGHGLRIPLRRRLPDRGRVVTRQPGVHEQHHGPSRGRLKTEGLQEKGLGFGIRPLWGPEWTRLLLPFTDVAGTPGGGPARPRSRSQAMSSGSQIGARATPLQPLRIPYLQGKGRGAWRSLLWGCTVG
jgi:hypothetical protein